MNKDLIETSKRMTWDEMVLQYPDKWVVLKNVFFSGPDIDSAEIVCVKDDADILDYQDEHLDDDLTFRRTTEALFC